MKNSAKSCHAIWVLLLSCHLQAAEPEIDLGDITEKHVMVPMRDGVKLSVYLYMPKGNGPWRALLEQRCSAAEFSRYAAVGRTLRRLSSAWLGREAGRLRHRRVASNSVVV